jgi:hypothetical protein
VAALAINAGLLARVPPPLLLLLLATVFTVLAFALPALRSWVRSADLRLFLLPHLVRFVGAVFLLRVATGALPADFTPIGWGDLASAIGAAMLLLIGAPAAPRGGRWRLWLAWNIFGVADMILLVVTGIRLATKAPEQFALFRQLPFGLLPTLAVPLILTTHVLIFTRLLKRAGALPSPARRSHS